MSKIDELIGRFRDAREQLSKQNISVGGGGTPNQAGGGGALTSPMGGTSLMRGDPLPDAVAMSEGDSSDSAPPANPHMGHSVFTMDHVNNIVKMTDHAAAKKEAHKIVDASTANPTNRRRIKLMINQSRNVADLARGMSNHILAHPSEGLKVVKAEKFTVAKNGQWSLDKIDPKENVNIAHPQTKAKMMRPSAKKSVKKNEDTKEEQKDQNKERSSATGL